MTFNVKPEPDSANRTAVVPSGLRRLPQQNRVFSAAEPLAGKSRADASERLRSAHEAAGHDKWFREQVDLAIKEADAPDAQWVSAADAKSSWTKKRAELVKRAEGAA